MKTFKKFGFMAFTALALVLTACSGSDDDGGGGSSLSTYINAKVDGTQFNTATISGQPAGIATKSGSGDQQLIAISCTDATALNDLDFLAMQVIIVGQVTAGTTYQVGPASGSSSILSYSTNVSGSGAEHEWDTDDCDGATGSFTVTLISDTKIEGTFTFTGKETENCSSQKVVTEGKFRGTFQQ